MVDLAVRYNRLRGQDGDGEGAREFRIANLKGDIEGLTGQTGDLRERLVGILVPTLIERPIWSISVLGTLKPTIVETGIVEVTGWETFLMDIYSAVEGEKARRDSVLSDLKGKLRVALDKMLQNSTQKIEARSELVGVLADAIKENPDLEARIFEMAELVLAPTEDLSDQQKTEIKDRWNEFCRAVQLRLT